AGAGGGLDLVPALERQAKLPGDLGHGRGAAFDGAGDVVPALVLGVQPFDGGAVLVGEGAGGHGVTPSARTRGTPRGAVPAGRSGWWCGAGPTRGTPRRAGARTRLPRRRGRLRRPRCCLRPSCRWRGAPRPRRS